MEVNPYEQNTLFELNNALPSLEVALKGLNLRNKAVSGNIANVNSPGYKRQLVSFEEALQKVQSGNRLSDIPMQKTHHLHFSNDIFKINEIKPEMGFDLDTEFNSDENNVDIDKEVIDLAQTGMHFKAISEFSKRNFESLRGVIRS
jgi:flagellar basal-body rod protein FlgB